MKIAYFDCFSGISGNMFVGALIDAGINKTDFINELKNITILPRNRNIFQIKKVKKNGISGTYFDVGASLDKIPEKLNEGKNISWTRRRLFEPREAGRVTPPREGNDFSPHKNYFRNLMEIESIIKKSNLSSFVKEKSLKIFFNLAKAEAKVHGTIIHKIHFHEVGAIDSIVDIIGACIAIEILDIKEIYCSPIPINRGFVNTRHGKFPLPAPAILELLKDIPVTNSDNSEEIVTPTGAAIISTLSIGFGHFPQIKIQKVGYGAGKRNYDIPNYLRVVIGEKSTCFKTDDILLIETNIDDMNPQIYDILFERLFINGALDVYLCNIQMKKNRPAVKLSVMIEKGNLDKIAKIILSETTSFGIRIIELHRYKIDKMIEAVKTKYGNINVKKGMIGNDIIKYSPEYEDCKKAAIKYNVPLRKVFEELNGRGKN